MTSSWAIPPINATTIVVSLQLCLLLMCRRPMENNKPRFTCLCVFFTHSPILSPTLYHQNTIRGIKTHIRDKFSKLHTFALTTVSHPNIAQRGQCIQHIQHYSVRIIPIDTIRIQDRKPKQKRQMSANSSSDSTFLLPQCHQNHLPYFRT